ncbi:exo-alpha-sialidase [Flagellimonas sp. 389]|uniref:Kelch repeat-containing protein n=1 Tax=Flagellimonas sp. 389 TaxID=2835862 RepID=UPI001BD3821B|nr:sialidase family protein [Flagellimonas sp. 389]MBS9462742.1 exo-alpha-sialidase [Flagellimonas sp. 389]
MKICQQFFLSASILTCVLSCSKDDGNGPDEGSGEGQNTPPESFELLTPTDNAREASVFPTLSWEAATDADGDTITYNVYLGTEENPATLLVENISATSFKVTEALTLNETYYWKVEAIDNNGGATVSTILSFTSVIDFDIETVTANASFPGRSNHTTLVYDEKIWVIGGYNDSGILKDVWYSEDGITWTEATSDAGFSERRLHTSVVFDGKMWVIGGADRTSRYNDVWYSEDGITWTEATSDAGFSERNSHASVVFDGKMWVIGGSYRASQYNDVWYSKDGVTWTEATGSASFSQRSVASSFVFDDKMWIAGGSSGSRLSDVWYSEDGVNWTKAKDNDDTSFHGGSSLTVLPYDNELWYSYYGIWKSSDSAATWERLLLNAPFGVRDGNTCTVFDDKIWFIGGYDYGGETHSNDVWTLSR